MPIQSIVNQFNDNCANFAKQQNALSTDKRTERNSFIYSITLSMIKLEFVFITRESVYTPPCTMFCRIYLNKNSQAYFLLPDIFAYANIEEYRCVFFTYIESKERLNLCFEELVKIINEYIPTFNEIILKQKADEIHCKQFEYILNRLSVSIDVIDYKKIDTVNCFDNKYFSSLQSLNENYTVMLFTNNDAYYAFLTKDIANAERLYAKRMQKDGVHPFEKLMCDFIKSDEYKSFTPIAENCFTQSLVNDKLKGKHSYLKNLRNFAITLILLSSVFLAITMIIKLIIFKSAIYVAGMTIGYAIITALFASLLPAMTLSLAHSSWYDKIFSKNDYTLLKNLRAIITQKKDRTINNIVIIVSCIIGIIFVIYMSATNIQFYKDKMFVCDIKQTEYSYNNIENIYYIKSRYNVYGDVINRSSYVIVFNNGESIDLDEWTTVKNTEKYILPILDKVPIIVESDKDLP